MENHPIPQDITGFQFKLIGSMTVKQFAYLAAGVILGWVIYIFPLPALLKIPLALFFVISGVCLAFLSVAGRPMDVMLSHLIKALFSPTQYIYRKTGGDLSKYQVSNSKQQTANVKKVTVSPAINLPKAAGEEKGKGLSFKGLGIHLPKKTPASAKSFGETKGKHVSEEELKKEYEEAQEIALQKELELAEEEEEKSQGKPSFEEAHAKVLSLSEALQKTMSEKEALERQILELQKRLTGQAQNITLPNQTLNPQPIPAKKIAANQAKASGVPLSPEAPNLVIGIIKDPRGNPLSNILVEVKDTDGNPVRAFKTSGLGQFASATPLSNGSYTISFEDPKGQQKFDNVQFQAEGEIIPPIEVVSVDAREELRRSLFS